MQLLFSSNYHVFGGGLWILPLLTLAGAVWFYHVAHKAHNSNSTQQVDLGVPGVHTEDNTGNVPLHSIGQFWFAVALFAATVAIITALYLQK